MDDSLIKVKYDIVELISYKRNKFKYYRKNVVIIIAWLITI